MDYSNFIEQEVIKDLESGRYDYVQTRQPPEPSGYLHIAHVRGIMLNYGLAEKYRGLCTLRFDDTNPEKESEEFIEAIKRDVSWLGYKWHDVKFATDYFGQNYEIALKLIKDGKAYVCDLTSEQLSEYRGNLTEAGKNSPFRERSVEENLDLFERMKNGEFEQGSRALRAKIDMAHPNMLMRDPVIYRIQYAPHHRIGTSWKIYPTYDFSHPLDDSLEGVTHSICGSEFIEHRPLYDWVTENSGLKHTSRQVEYYNLYIENVILGKRHIKRLVAEGVVAGFDDPRLYTLAGLRRRGVLPESIKNFTVGIGLGKEKSIIDPRFLEHFIRETLNEKAKRVMAVLNPLKLEITNYPEGATEDITLENYPQIEEGGTRTYKFGRHLIIEQEDFAEVPPPKYHRLYVGAEVRLKGAYIVKCTGFEKDENGNVTKVLAEYDPETKSGNGNERKVKGTIHFLHEKHMKAAEVRLYENLFEPDASDISPPANAVPPLSLRGNLASEPSNPPLAKGEGHASGGGYVTINGLRVVPNSKKVISAYVEDAEYDGEERYQFIRCGYFCLDKDSAPEKLVFNRTITLKDNFKV